MSLQNTATSLQLIHFAYATLHPTARNAQSRLRQYIESGEALECLTAKQRRILLTADYDYSVYELSASAKNASDAKRIELTRIELALASEAERLDLEHQIEIARAAGDIRTIDQMSKALGGYARFALQQVRVKYFAFLTQFSEADLLRLEHLGPKSLGQVKAALKDAGLSLKEG